MSIGERIFAVRKRLGMNQTEFGKEILLSQTAVGQIESNTRTSTERTILLICSKFHVSSTWLRTGEGEMFDDCGDDFVSELSTKYNLDPLQQSLVRAVYEMPQEYRTMILALARRLVAENEAALEETDEERTKRIIRAARAEADQSEADQNADKRA